MMRRRKMTKGATTTKIESMYVEYQKRLAKKNYSIALTLASCVLELRGDGEWILLYMY